MNLALATFHNHEWKVNLKLLKKRATSFDSSSDTWWNSCMMSFISFSVQNGVKYIILVTHLNRHNSAFIQSSLLLLDRFLTFGKHNGNWLRGYTEPLFLEEFRLVLRISSPKRGIMNHDSFSSKWKEFIVL